MRPAEARFKASAIAKISIKLSLVGAQVGCRIKTSRPRTFSNSSMATSPSENLVTDALPIEISRCFTTLAANFGLALPVKTIKLSYAAISSSLGMGLFASYLGNIAGASLVAWRSQTALYACGEIQPNKK